MPVAEQVIVTLLIVHLARNVSVATFLAYCHAGRPSCIQAA